MSKRKKFLFHIIVDNYFINSKIKKASETAWLYSGANHQKWDSI